MSYVPKVKICGLRDGDSAVEAARAGADYLGFNLVEGVRRQLTRFQAQEVVRNYRIRARDHRIKRIRQKGPQVVGLFRNQDARWVNKSTQQVDLDCVQLCGEEGRCVHSLDVETGAAAGPGQGGYVASRARRHRGSSPNERVA